MENKTIINNVETLLKVQNLYTNPPIELNINDGDW